MTLPITLDRIDLFRDRATVGLLSATEALQILDALKDAIRERDELRAFLERCTDIELRDGTWLERHGMKWNAYRNTVAVLVGATLEEAAAYLTGGAG